MPDWISHEPVLIATLINAVIDLAIVFGVPITIEQKTAIIGVVGALSAIVVRSKVTPQTKIDQVPVAARALEQAEAAKA